MLPDTVARMDGLQDLIYLNAEPLRGARDVLAMESIVLYGWDAAAGLLYPLLHDSDPAAGPAPMVRRGQGVVGQAFERAEPMAALHMQDDGVAALAQSPYHACILAVPLALEGIIVGVLVAHAAQPRPMTAADADLLCSLAATLAPALPRRAPDSAPALRRLEGEVLGDLARQSLAAASIADVMALVTHHVTLLLGVDYAAVALHGEDETVTWHGVRGQRALDWTTKPLTAGGAAVEQIRHSGCIAMLDHAGRQVDVPLATFPIHQHEAGQTALHISLVGRTGVMGTLILGWRAALALPLAQIRIAERLAQYAALILDNVYAHARAEQFALEAAGRAAELAAVLEQLPSGVMVLDAAGRPAFFNEAARQITGTLGELRADAADELHALVVSDALGHPVLADQTPVARALAGETVQAMELIYRRPGEAEDRWLRSSAVPLRATEGHITGAVTVFSDVTRERQWHTLYATMACGVIVLSENGIIVNANDSAQRILGCSLDELRRGPIMRPFWRAPASAETVPSDEERSLAAVFEQARPVHDVVTQVTRPDGQQLWVQVDAVPVLDDSGRVQQIVCSFIDITERKRAEDGLIAKTREQEAFIYTVSHDLKAPLLSLQGMATILLDDYAAHLPEEARQYVARIMANGSKLRQLLDDLLTLSRVGRAADASAVELGTVVQAVLDQLQHTLAARGATVQVEGDLPTVFATPLSMEQILTNLVDNAVHYTPPQRHPQVRIRALERGAMWEIVVADNGIGVPRMFYDKIFGIFQRLPAGKALRSQGTGVGLAIVARIVGAYGGQIWLESTEDVGTEMHFTVPADSQAYATGSTGSAARAAS